MGCQSPSVPFIIVGAWGFAFEPSPFFWTIKISPEKAETNQWKSTGLISVLLDRSNLSQESLVVVYHLCTPKHGAIDRRLACDAEGAKQVLRGFRVCIQLFVIQIFVKASLDALITSGAASVSWSELSGGVTATRHSSNL